ADCAPMLSTLTIDSPGFAAAPFPDGAFMDLSIRIDYPFGCSQTLLVKRLPSWGGEPSPGGGTLPILWFAGSEGSTAVNDGSPFTIETIPLGCHTGEPPGCGPADDYALKFYHTVGEGGLLLGMGESATWEVTDQGAPS